VKQLHRLRNERRSEKTYDLEKIVRANHQPKQTSPRDLVAFFILAAQLREDEMVVEVAGDACEKEKDPRVFQVDCGFGRALREILSVDHDHGVDSVAEGYDDG